MTTVYIGTSSERSWMLSIIGWPTPLPCTRDYTAAVAQARNHALIDGGEAVVLCANVRLPETASVNLIREFDPGELHIANVLGGETARERLGFTSTASIGGVMSGLLNVLDEAHKTLVNVVNTGAGGSATIPTPGDIKDIFDSHRGLERIGHKIAKIRKVHNVAIKAAKKAKNAVTQKPAPSRGPVRSDKQAKPNDAKTPPPKDAKWGKTAPKSDARVAGKDIVVKGTMNGKAASYTIRKGVSYRVKDEGGKKHLVIQGMRGTFILSAGDAGKLK